MKINIRGFLFYAILLSVLFFTVIFSNQSFNQKADFGYTEFNNRLEEGQVVRVDIKQNLEIPTGVVSAVFRDGSTKSFPVPDVGKFHDDIKYNNIPIFFEDVARPNWFVQLLPSILVLVPVGFLLFFILSQSRRSSGSGNSVMSFGKSKAKMVIDNIRKVTFKNVAGLQEEKEELEEVVDFLKSPRKFVDLGARIPKGVLLVGPPGTGKTLLAKAVAGEAGVPFFSISGSDFVEMFVGVGASRVRDLFAQAKKNAPCIVFIDEIDAVGRKRGAGLGGGHDEREQTLNQLLVEMDGFGINEGVIVVAATNRADVLDPALLRPGRFDRKVVVGRPDVKGREEILKVHAKGKPLSDEVDLGIVAKTTAGFTGADLENLLNEASIFAARDDRKVIEQEDLQKAFIKVGIGTEKKSRVITNEEKKITAYHEAGHAIIHHELPELDPVHSISIVPTGFAGGYTMPLPGKDPMYLTKKKMEQEIVSLLGGRAAEQLVLDDITTGASNDIERATGIARNMVIKYGMSDAIGPIQFGGDNDEVFIGRDWGHTRNYGESIAKLIDGEIKRIIDQGYDKAIKILTEHIDILHKTAKLLMEEEKVSGKKFNTLFKNKKGKSDNETIGLATV